MHSYRIDHSHGTTEYADTYDDAIDMVRAVYTDCEIGHDGDIPDGGERTLVWADEASSVNDDGSRAVASITRLHDDTE